MVVPPVSWLIWEVIQKSSCSLHVAMNNARLLSPAFPLWDHHIPAQFLSTSLGIGEFHQGFAAPRSLCMAAYATCTSSWCCFR